MLANILAGQTPINYVVGRSSLSICIRRLLRYLFVCIFHVERPTKVGNNFCYACNRSLLMRADRKSGVVAYQQESLLCTNAINAHKTHPHEHTAS